MVRNGIEPHGGRLINRTASPDEEERLLSEARGLKHVQCSTRELRDLAMIGVGAYSPLEGFMAQADYERVVEERRLKSGLVWTIPITVAAWREDVRGVEPGERVALVDAEQNLRGLMDIEDVYPYDKEREARSVYLTTDRRHPGVRALSERGELLLGGPVRVFSKSGPHAHGSYYLRPEETRATFQKLGWKRVVGFQTRNPLHRAHEYILKCAMEQMDGLFLSPLVGETKPGDVPASVRMQCYEALLSWYFPVRRVVLGVIDVAMRYAGPREAIFHALIRQNFGCTHFIVGRDHAGVGNFYGPFDAHRLFEELGESEIRIQPLFFDDSFYCRRCLAIATRRTCPHTETEHQRLSGTEVRELLARGEHPPEELIRPEVAAILLGAYREGAWQTGQEGTGSGRAGIMNFKQLFA